MWVYYNPVKIIVTDDFLSELVKVVEKYKGIALLCEERLLHTMEYSELIHRIKIHQTYTAIEIEPSFLSCNNAIGAVYDNTPDLILAIGGGSVMDTAKAVRAALNTNTKTIEELLRIDLPYENNTDMIAIPTTHGTSSELTKWATIWNKVEKKKYSLSRDENYPTIALYDYHFVQNLPIDVSLISSLDAMSHAFEALWNRNANPVSDRYAFEAIKVIYDNLEHLHKDCSPEARKMFLSATMFAGLAFSNTKTAAAHAISYPMTSLFGVPHGIACSITLPSLAKKNFAVMGNKMRELLDYLHLDKFDEFWVKIWKAADKYIPYHLQDYGINESTYEQIISNGFNKDRIGNNIVVLTISDVEDILLDTMRRS
jgi:alcohol dehydrogenase class IV